MMGWDDALIIAGISAAGSAAAAGISSAVGSATSTRVARKTAKYNLRNAKEQMAYQDELQRLYSKDMTKWGLLTNPQYKMAGLKAAGLNPILAYDFGNANLASASYSAGMGASASYTPANTSGIDISSAYDAVQRGDKTGEEKGLVKPLGMAQIENTKTQADLNATRVSSEETRQDVDTAQAEKLREETAGVRLNNKLKAATNARDINRAKTEYEVESAPRPNASTDGSAPLHDSPLGKKLNNAIQNDAYLNNRERSILLDAARALEGGVSAYSTFKTARNGGMIAGAARKGAASQSKNAETNRRNVELKERAEQRMLRRRKKK